MASLIAAHRRRFDQQSTSGFSVIEIVVAVLVLTVVLVSAGVLLSDQFDTIAAAKNEQVGEGLVSRTLAQVRALPYDDIKNGLSDKDSTTLATPLITPKGTTWTFTSSAEHLTGTGELIPHFTPGSSAEPPVPLYPHRHTVTENTVAYTVAVIPSELETPPAGTTAHTPKVVPGAFRVTVLVSWQQPGHHLPTEITGQTVVYSAAANCINATTHPVAAPCRPNFTTSGSVGDGSITIQAATGSPYAVEGMTFTSFGLSLDGAGSIDNLVQTSTVTGWAQGTGVLSGDGSSNAVKVESTASDDPSSGHPAYTRATLVQTAIAVTATGTATSTLTATPSSGDTGDTVSTESSTATRACDNLAGAPVTTKTPCGSGEAHQESAASLHLDLHAGAVNLGTAPLVTIAPQPIPSTDRVETIRSNPSQGTCPATASDGCTAVTAQEDLGPVSIGGIPATMPPPAGWTATKGLVQVNGWSAQASAAVTSGTGTGHVTEKVTVPASGQPAPPTVVWWNGSSYTTTTLTGASASITPATVTGTVATSTNGQIEVTVTPTISIKGSAKRETTSTSTGCKKACQAWATVTSPITGTLHYQIVQGSSTLADFTLVVELGNMSVHGSYQAAQ